MKQMLVFLALTVGFAAQSEASLASSTAVGVTKRMFKYAQKNKLKPFVKSLDGDALLKYGSQEGMSAIASQSGNYKNLTFSAALVSTQEDPVSMFPIEIINVEVYADKLADLPMRTVQLRCSTHFYRSGGICGVRGICSEVDFDSTCSVISLGE